jgi:4-amino-4-deoxy-L-arabinose transferase-like glycosyltransferase
LVAIAILMLLVGSAWYVYVFKTVPGVWTRWRIELARTAPGEKSGNPLSYLSLFAYMLPWTAVLIHGVVWTAVESLRRKIDGMTLALLLVLVPVVLMSFFPDRKERYLLPLAGPAAVLAARGITAMLDPTERRRTPPWVQWAIVAVIGVGLPIAGATTLQRVNGAPWYSPALAACAAVFVGMQIVIAAQQARRHPFLLVIGPAVIMLLLQPTFLYAYRDAREGCSEMRPLAETIRFAAPTARVYYWRPDGKKRADVSLSIYLNRPTVWVADPSEVPQGDVPAVIVAQEKPGGPPRKPPDEWLFLDDAPHDKDRYLAFVRPPR